jgi:hypothetical protein
MTDKDKPQQPMKHIKFSGNFVAFATVSPPDNVEAWGEIDALCDGQFKIVSSHLYPVGAFPSEAMLYVVLQYTESETYFANKNYERGSHQ